MPLMSTNVHHATAPMNGTATTHQDQPANGAKPKSLAASSNTPMTSSAMGNRVGRAAGNVAQHLGGALAFALVLGAAASLTACDRAGPSDSGKAVADPMATLARQHACLNCHAYNRKLVGPSFADIAGRYGASAQNQPEVVALLAQRIREGGSGSWGVVAMPASPSLSAPQAEALARWVLTQGSN
jgi:cytochrome c551/c552